MPRRAKPARKRRSSRRTLILLTVGLCLVATVAATVAFDRLPSLIGDNAEFVILARALAEGKGFCYINHPQARPATKYPPGFPALLAAWSLAFGSSIVSMKIPVVICFVGSVALTFLLGRKLLGDRLGTLAALLIALSSAVIAYSHQILSDVPYMLFSLMAIYLLITGYRRKSTLAAGMLLCIWAYLVRTVGVSLVLAAVVFLFVKARRREALALIICFLLVSALWAVRNYVATGEGSRYAQVLLSANPYDPDRGAVTFTGLINRVGINAAAYLGRLIPVNLLPTLVGTSSAASHISRGTLISILVMVVTVLGGYVLRKKAQLINTYVLAYFGVYLLWPEVWKSERFMVPIAPLVAICFFAGVRRILEYFEVREIAVSVVCAVLALTNILSLSDYAKRPRGYPPGWVHYFNAASWVEQYTPQESVVLCRKPFLFYIFSNRRTISYPFTRDKQAMRDYLNQARPDYIIIDDFGGGTSTTEVYLVPVLRELSHFLRPVFRTEEPVNQVLQLSLPQQEPVP